MTALEYTTNFVIKTLQENRLILESRLPDACSCSSWEEAIEKITLNKYDTVDWVLSEVFSGNICKEFKLSEFIGVQNCSEVDFLAMYVYKINGRNVMVKCSAWTQMVWTEIEFFFVEEKEILIPKKIWEIVEN